MYDGDDGHGPPGPVRFDAKGRNVMNLYDVGMSAMALREVAALRAMCEQFVRPGGEAAAACVGREDTLRQRSQQLNSSIATMLWNSDKGMFTNRLYDLASGATLAPYPRISPTALYPMMAGTPSDAQAEEMMKTLRNASMLNVQWPLPIDLGGIVFEG